MRIAGTYHWRTAYSIAREDNFHDRDITPEELMRLAKKYDVMLVEHEGKMLLRLDDKNSRFRQR